jgi:hypothetical protein
VLVLVLVIVTHPAAADGFGHEHEHKVKTTNAGSVIPSRVDGEGSHAGGLAVRTG